MLKSATLLISSPTSEFIGVCVANFPILPVGSSINLYLTEKSCLEGGKIVSYTADNKRGVQIEIALSPQRVQGLVEIWQNAWDELKAACVEDPTRSNDYVYPRRIDFAMGNSYPTILISD